MEDQDEEIHFYHELKKKKYYEPLIPKKEAGLVIIFLYDQWMDGKFISNSFTEEAVTEAIRHVSHDLGKVYDRVPHSQFKEVNLTLQQYLLFRNEETNLYHITQYGIEFCERVKEKLTYEFKPSDIEKILTDLIQSLEKYISYDDFPHWYKHHFSPQRATLRNQIETLLKRVEYAVIEFREATKADDESFLKTVRKVDESLEKLAHHAIELKDAFFGAEEIKGLLLEFSFIQNSSEVQRQSKFVMDFITEINNDFNIIGQRIDRIRPKLKQFIASINQRIFDRNTELFLRLLLEKSNLDQKGNRKKINLPDGVSIKSIYNVKSDFIIVEPDRLQAKQPAKLIMPKEDGVKREKQLNKAKDKLYIRQRIRYWVKLIDAEIKKEEIFHFTRFYIKILHEEPRFSTTISLKVASQVFRKYSKLKNYSVEIKRTFVIDPKTNKNAIWKLKIQKRKIR